MIEQELLLLGLLQESPKHGYEIKKSIKDILSIFAGVELKSIYYPLMILEKRKLVAKRTTKPTRRPQRTVYCLTPKGSARFEELLTKSILSFKRPQFSLDLSLYFLRYLKPKVACRRLRARLSILKKIAGGLKQMISVGARKKNPALSLILEHNLKMLEAEHDFLAGLIRSL